MTKRSNYVERRIMQRVRPALACMVEAVKEAERAEIGGLSPAEAAETIRYADGMLAADFTRMLVLKELPE